jgi:hypothetical protein
MTVANLPVIPDDGHAVEHVFQANPTGGRLVAWAEAAHAAASLGTSLSKTSFVPKDFRGKPEECAAAILLGDEIGLTPLQSLQGVFVISGRPGLYARTMVAVVLAAGHEIVTTHKTDKAVTVRGRRRGSDTWVEEQWTTDRARRAGYTNNKKYETDPQSMLYARAAADVCRQIAPDALAGLAYTVEELEMSEQATVKVTRSETTAGKTTVKRATAPAIDPGEPSFDEPVDQETGEIVEAVIVDEPQEQEPTSEPMVTSSQLTKLGVVFNANGIKDRDERLAYVSEIVGRPLTTSKELTKTEASRIIDGLESLAGIEEPTFEDQP